MKKSIQAYRLFMEPAVLIKASMLQDLEMERKTEINDINGVIPSQAKGTGIATPFNDLIVKLVKQAEERQSVPDFDTNIQFFRDLIELTKCKTIVLN